MKFNNGMSCTILMTACIDPSKGVIKVHRNDPIVRLTDYEKALKFWLMNKDPRLNKIVFVDNSGYPLEGLISLAQDCNPLNKEVEIISLNCNDYPSGVHYGYAELKMIDEAFLVSKILPNSLHFIKVTGRLKFKNISRLINFLSIDQLFSVDSRNRNPFKKIMPPL